MRVMHRLVVGMVRFALILLALPALAVSGRVVDPEGKPIQGARVCHVQQGTEQICSATQADGSFELIDISALSVRAVADGFLPEERPGVGRHDPIVLRRAPTLTVRLIDAASGEAIDKAEVLVRYGSREKGPFPANRAGVRIQRVLEPGEVSLIGRAEGYEDGDPTSATLEGGKEIEVVLALRKRAGTLRE